MEKINGLVLAKMIDLGARNLAKNAEKINSLNVFPVPDGDTGTNMNLSMSSGAKETAANTVENIGELGKSFSKGLLMGARGNSGVILSQLFRGMSQYIVDKKEIDSKEFAAAIQNGVSIAYKAIIKPVEGTILTVAREAAEAGVKKAESTTSVIEVMEAIYAEAQESLKRTPDLLPILKEVGVVDSGGQGLVCVYQGFVAALKGEEIDGLDAVETNIVDMQFEDNHDMDFMNPEDIVYGFCTEFTVRLDKDKKEFEKFQNELKEKIKNEKDPKKREELEKQVYRKVSDIIAQYHNIEVDENGEVSINLKFPNEKHVNNVGQEAVFSKKSGEWINDGINNATYNIAGLDGTIKGAVYDNLIYHLFVNESDVNLWIKYDVGPNSKLTEVQRRQLNEIGSRYYLDPIFRDYVNTKGKLNYRIYEDYTQMIEGGL
mgnify:CR=1 FL=1